MHLSFPRAPWDVGQIDPVLVDGCVLGQMNFGQLIKPGKLLFILVYEMVPSYRRSWALGLPVESTAGAVEGPPLKPMSSTHRKQKGSVHRRARQGLSMGLASNWRVACLGVNRVL